MSMCIVLYQGHTVNSNILLLQWRTDCTRWLTWVCVGTVGQAPRATVIPWATDSLSAHVNSTSTPAGTSALVSTHHVFYLNRDQCIGEYTPCFLSQWGSVHWWIPALFSILVGTSALVSTHHVWYHSGDQYIGVFFPVGIVYWWVLAMFTLVGNSVLAMYKLTQQVCG